MNIDIPQLVKQIPESALSAVGIRTGTEEPRYLARTLTEKVEIRRYGPRIVAETTVFGEKDRALSAGFRRLACYIFGGNHRHESIAMTAPVGQHRCGGGSIDLTAPVAQDGSTDRGWTVRFFMPSKWSLATLPTPDDDDVRLISVPAETVAVLRFSGDRGPGAVAVQTEALLDALCENDIQPAGEVVAWFYDPPWTLPFRRRNEVAVPI